MSNSILAQRWPWLSGAAILIGVVLFSSFEFRFGGPDARPLGSAAQIEQLAERDDINVLFILIDTLRAEHMGMYGYERDTTPVMDHVANRGIVFARHLSQSSWTKCSMASLWTSLYPARAGVTRFNHKIPEEAVMPAEILKEAGFRTAGMFRNGWVEGYFGFEQGFDTYTRPLSKGIPESARRQNPTLIDKGTDMDLVDSAMEFLRIHGKDRWFLYLHGMDLHEYLYDEDTAVFGTGYEDNYDNAIFRTDKIISELFSQIADAGYLENTVVVISSDHGEAFGERGHEGHARRVYRETTEVPFILSLPFALEPGLVVQQRSRNVDIWPTLLDLLGLPPMENVDGRSRLPAILAAAKGETLADDMPGYAHLDQTWGRKAATSKPTVAVADQGFRFVLSHSDDGRKVEELFDAKSDAGELRNVIQDNPERAELLRGLAESYLESKPAWEGDVQPLELDEMQLQQLRALGYKIP
jgi:arylsulfatase A-like enzyme